MKLWDVILTANANLSRNKVRTFLTIIAVFIGAFTIALTAGVNAGVNDYIDRQLGNIGGESMLEVQAKQTSAAISTGPQEYDPDASKSNDALGLGLTMLKQSDIEKIAAIDNIKSVTPGVAVVATWIQGVNDKKYNITIGQMVEGLNVDLAYGTPPSNSTDDYQMALSDGYATVLGFNDAQDAVGKTVTFAATTPLGEIKTVEAKVVGIQNNNLISSSGSLVNDSLNNALYDITTEGNKAMVNIYKPGAFFPISSVVNSTFNNYYFEAITDVSVRQMSSELVEDFLRENPLIVYDLLKRLYRGVDGLLRRMVLLLGETANTRLLYELFLYADRFGRKQLDGSMILDITAKELAQQTGLARETVSRELKKLKELNVLLVERGQITLLSR